MLKNFSWLDRYSFAQLEQIRNAIVNRQMKKANAFVKEVEQDVIANQTIIQNIDNQITQIDKMGLSDTYKKAISQWRDWQYNIYLLKQYNVNSATMLDSFRFLANKCGLLDGSFGVQDKLNELAGNFSKIINAIQTNNPDQYQRHQWIQKLKHRLSVFKGQHQQWINNIDNMLYENNFYVYNEIRKQEDYMTKFQKYCNALMLLSGGHMEILERDSWKKLTTHDQIIQEIDNRIKNMYNMCAYLSNPSRSYCNNNNYINNNSISGLSNGYGQPQL